LDAKLPARPDNDVPFVSSDLLEEDEPTNPAMKLALLLSRPPSVSPPAEPAPAAHEDPQPIPAVAEATRTPIPSAPKDLPKAFLPELPPTFPSSDVPPTLRTGARLPPELHRVEQADDPEVSFAEAPAELLPSDAPAVVSQPPPRATDPGRASWLRKPVFGWAIAATVALALGTAAGAMLRPKPQLAAVDEVALPGAPAAEPEPKKPAESPQRERLAGELPAGQAPRPGTEPAEPAPPPAAAAPVEMKSVEVHVTPARAQIVAGADRLGEGTVTVQVAPGEKKVLAGILAGYRTRKVVIDGSKAVVKIELTADTPVQAPTPKEPPPAPVAKTQPDNPPANAAAAPAAPTKSFASDTPTPAGKAQPPRGNRPWEPENFAEQPGH
jgi:hypothetical protein